MIAEGRGDFYYEAGTHCWDICAGIVLVQESGGKVYNWQSDSKFDMLDRTIVAIRGGSTKNAPDLIKEFNTVAINIEYKRD